LKIYQAGVSDKLSARTLVGIILTLNRHPERSKAITEVALRLSAMQDSLIDYRRVREVIMALIRTRDTDRISTKMKEEVIPEIMKLQPDILKKMREASPDAMEGNALEYNPEWEEMLNKSGLSEKMRELSDMQSDGADLMMVAFSNLKQFSFFNVVSNWFLPFFSSHSALSSGEKEKSIIDRLMEIGRNVCDSDKYSLAIALGKMPDQQKNMMMAQLDAQFSQLSEDIKEKAMLSTAPEFDEEVTKVLRDLYRFFRLYRKKQGFKDPFEKPLAFLDIPFIGDMMSDTEVVSIVAEFYFNRKYYGEALSLFTLLLDENPDDPALWEKAGACFQALKFFEKALDAYTKAELLKTPGKWLLQKLAFVNRKQGNYAKALEYYNRLLEKDPENLNLMLNAGFSALESGNVSEALKYYYHANYIEPDNIKIFRAIAWSEFLSGNAEKSEKYYDKILKLSPESSDFLNAGHLFAVKGDLKRAVSLYKKAAEGNYTDFRNAFLADIEVLEKLGLQRASLLILLDYIGIENKG
ncbi:MAG: tetratricopeptide repeat protein, partial [Muribaculaceae bacterium]|nr:tetratricopeptide repeat protein [Muribaculaceae bacterium]